MRAKRQPLGPDSPAAQRALKTLREHGPLTHSELADKAHISVFYWQNTLRPLLIKAGLIHQSGWRRNSPGHPSPLFAVGPPPPGWRMPRKPSKTSSAKRSREWKERTGYLTAQKAARRLARPEGVMAALLGMGA